MATVRSRRIALGVLAIVSIGAVGLLAGWMAGHDGSGQPDDPPAAPQSPAATPVHENRLAKEPSPYLQLHKHNPVDWFPWGEEAFAKAKAENKVIFLSIGYSACYWCHVMERESFSNPEIAKILNEHFVCIKVDREELPDVDEVYMNAVVMLNRGRGGWPLSVFLTPDGHPFHGGTYYPPEDREQMVGFPTVLREVNKAWGERRAQIEDVAARCARALEPDRFRGFGFGKIGRETIAKAVDQLAERFDKQHGGFGYDPDNPWRPKFPQPSNLQLLLYHARTAKDEQSKEMLRLTLERLSHGGISDHLGGGFHRYSTDRFWQVPHFEKMLYDNAQLASVYLEAFEMAPQHDSNLHVAGRVFAFLAREMRSPEGGFYSAIDAESEEEEGKYYVWRKEEIQELLQPHEFRLFELVNGLEAAPFFPREAPDRYVLQIVAPLDKIAAQFNVSRGDLAGALQPIGAKLLAARERRTRPLVDTKILTDWNGLVIAALADGYRVSRVEGYRKAAEDAANLLLEKARDPDGRLQHMYMAGVARVPGYLEDYAFLLHGLLALHRATGDESWLHASRRLADQMVELFWDETSGGFFRTASDQEVVLVRLKPAEDSVVPSGNSVAVRALVSLAERSGDKKYAELAGKTLAAFASQISDSPGAFPHMIRGLGEFLDAGYSLGEQPANAEADVVRAQVVLSLDRLQPGREFQLAALLDIAPEWHIYANPPSQPELNATTLELASDPPPESVTVTYPRPEPFRAAGADQVVDVYSGRAVIKASAKLGQDAAPGTLQIELSLRYQACTTDRCLAPTSLEIVVPAEVVGPDEPVREQYPEIFRATKSTEQQP